MKGIPIKFRGKSDITGKFIYGIGVKIKPDYAQIISDGYCYEDVEKDSVAQLVGYDVDGNEIYEDDEILHIDYKIKDARILAALQGTTLVDWKGGIPPKNCRSIEQQRETLISMKNFRLMKNENPD